MQKLISNQNQNHSLGIDLKSKSQFKNLISNCDFRSFDFKSYPTLVEVILLPENWYQKPVLFVWYHFLHVCHGH